MNIIKYNICKFNCDCNKCKNILSFASINNINIIDCKPDNYILSTYKDDTIDECYNKYFNNVKEILNEDIEDEDDNIELLYIQTIDKTTNNLALLYKDIYNVYDISLYHKTIDCMFIRDRQLMIILSIYIVYNLYKVTQFFYIKEDIYVILKINIDKCYIHKGYNYLLPGAICYIYNQLPMIPYDKYKENEYLKLEFIKINNEYGLFSYNSIVNLYNKSISQIENIFVNNLLYNKKSIIQIENNFLNKLLYIKSNNYNVSDIESLI
jgi:hypothetical protein